jgi:hypothetical protein
MELLIIIVAALALVGGAAQRWGVDSRDLSIDPRYPQVTGLF